MSGRNRGVSSHACNRNGWWIAAVRRPGALLAIVALCGGLFATPAAAQWAASDLFPNPPVPTKAGPHGLESLAGVLDTAPVTRGLGRLRLQLPGGGTVEMARDGFERRKDGDVTWRGGVTGDEGSRVILTIRNGYMAGRIVRGLEEYEIRPGPGRSHVIERVDGSIEPVDEHVEPDIAYSEGIDLGIPMGDPITPSPTSNPDNIQLMVAYTPKARAAAGGTPQIEVRIQLMIDMANTAFIDSDMIARYALVRTEEVAYPESGDVTTDLRWAVTDFNIDWLRGLAGADMVSLIVENQGRCAGAAFVMNAPDYQFHWYAYQVTALSCGGGTFVHEHGHNMGFEHNPEDSTRTEPQPDPYNPSELISYPSYPWSFGHYVDGSFRTIMSYSTRCLLDCPAALRFSNPDITFLGSPTGILDERDNAQTGDLTAPIVAAFRDSVTGAVVNRRVAASVEDVEELADGSVVLNSTTLELGDGLSGVQAVGLRFQNLNIPVGTRINSAYVEFEAADIGSAATSVQIRAEAADSALPFSATAFDVTGRPATLASVAWDLPAWTALTEKHYSPDISAVIQEVVDRPGWLENNSMVLTVGGAGIRAALSHDGGAGAAPLLHVEYSSPGSITFTELEVSFSYNCTGLTCTFTDQSTSSNGPIMSWWWDFGYYRAETPVVQSPTVTFPAAGTYNISLEINDGMGGLGRTYQSFTITETGANIAPIATANFYYTKNDATLSGNVLTDGIPDSDFDGDPLTITANTSPYNNGMLSMAANGAFTYTPDAGFTGRDAFNYTISDGKGGTASATVTIEVESKVAVDFRYSCTDLDCSFADASTSLDGEIVGWAWYFYELGQSRNPGALYERNPSYTFPSSGTYEVVLTATDSNGVSATAGKLVTVNIDNYPPVASFSQSCVDLSCVFTDGSTDTEGAIAAWSWDFGDGAVSTVQNPTHNYTMAGTYTVTLTVTDAGGATGTAVQTIIVNTAPVAAFTASCADLNCAFTDGSTDIEGAIASWAWTFGDGASSTTQSPTHVYTADGIYAVTLTVTDGAGATDTVNQTVTVANTAPIASFTYSCADLYCSFTDSSTDADGISRWRWSFGDGETSVSQNPPHGYAADGTYTVTLTVTDTAGVTNTASQTITVVNTPPVASFSVNCAGVHCDFTDVSADADIILFWSWSFGDGTIWEPSLALHKSAFQYSYTADGTYTVILTVTDRDGATNTTSQTITVTNTAPVATANAYTLIDGQLFNGNVMTDGTPDSDLDGDVLTLTANTLPLSGTLWLNSDGSFTYSPPAGFGWTVSFDYTISDNYGGSDTATVTMVGPVNDAPVATANAYNTNEDTAVSGHVLFDGVADSDVNGDTLIVTANTSPLNGTVTVASTGRFTYTPTADFNGLDSFDYTISDMNGGVATATVTIAVMPVSDAPVATANVYATGEGTALSGNFVTDGIPDSDADGDTLTVTANTSPLSGTVTVAANGAFTYTPNADFNGSDGFDYTISDGNGGTASATVAITVNPAVPVNNAPVATANAYTTSEDAAVSGNVLIDGTPDSDIDGDALTVTANTSPLSGTVTVSASGAFTYTPNADFNGSDGFDYTISDGNGGTASATVTITVNPVIPVNNAPVATADAYTTSEDTAVGGNVLTDGTPDSDADGDALTVTANTSPLSGTVTVSASGAFTYTPNADFNGSDGFDYTISDGNGGTASASVTITVNPVNDAPVAAFSYSCAGLNCYFTNGSTDVDGGISSASWTFGDGGTSTVYTVPHVYAVDGTYTVTLTVTDNSGATGTVAQSVIAANTAPVAVDDAYTVAEDSSVSGNVMTGGTADSDADGDPMTVTANTASASGSVSMAANGAFTYVPNANFNGTDSFTYTIGDGNGGTAMATVTITVLAMNDAPVATDNAYTIGEDIVVSGNVLTDGMPDSDIDGDSVGIIGRTNPSFGTLWLNNADGAFTYTPNSDFNGTDSFTYTITDGKGTAETATVTITVSPVNDPPVAAFSHGCAGLNCTFTDGSSDPLDAGGAIASWAWSFGDGGVSTVRNPTHSYAADGAYTVSLTVTDNEGATDTVTQSVTVASAANTAPVATANTYATAEDVAVSGNVLTDGTPDSDADGDALTVTSNTSPSNGAAAVAANGAFTYTPAANFNGLDSFTYTINDGNGGNATATVTITVNPVNDVPVAAFSHGCTGLDCAFTDGSTDADGAIASWAWSFGDGAVSAAQNPAHGYAADGTYTVSLTATDNQGAADTVTQSVTVAGGPVAVGDIVMAPASYDFGAVLVGTTQSASLAIQNRGDGVLTVSGLTLTGGNPDFVLNGPAVPFDIQPGYQASVGVDYIPGAAGADSAALSVASNDPDTPTAAVPLSGSGVAGVPDVNFASTTLAFGDVAVGSTQRGYVDIQNVGSADLNIASMALSGSGDFAINSRYVAPFTIKPGRQARIKVEYTPGAAGPAAATLDIAGNDPDEPSVSASLSGNGIAPPVGNPDINLPSTTLVLGDVTVGATQRDYVDIQNVGDADLTIGSLAVTGSGDFVLGNPPAVPFVIRSGRQIRVKVEYVPSIDGPAAASLNVGSDDPDEPSVAASLSGNGIAGVQDINLPVVTLAFGDVETGTPQTGTLFIQNVGTADLTVSGLSLTGGNTDFVLNTAAPFTVLAGYQAAVTVTYSPSATGADVETLQIASDDPVDPNLSMSLSGNGTTPPAGTPDVNLPATSIAYGDVLVGKMKTASVAIQNLGTADLNVTGLTLTGSTDFALAAGAPTSFVVTPGRQVTVKVNYSPNAVGPVSGSLAIASDDPVDPTLSVSLNGTGLAGVADINLPVVSHDYGDVVVGASGSGYIAIQNPGTADLTVTGLALTGGGDFTLAAGTPATFVIAAGRQVTVRVDYMPSATGIVAGTLTITSADPDEPSVSVTLSGNGTPAV